MSGDNFSMTIGFTENQPLGKCNGKRPGMNRAFPRQKSYLLFLIVSTTAVFFCC